MHLVAINIVGKYYCYSNSYSSADSYSLLRDPALIGRLRNYAGIILRIIGMYKHLRIMLAL